jgi:hypothetical protein
MKRRAVFYSLTLLSLCTYLSAKPLVAASETNKSPLGIDLNDLYQHWVHSSEEEKTGEKDQIFRPAESREFPPSRFRMAYKFARNGNCEWLFLSPDDAHHFKAGKWKIDASDKTLLQITTNETMKSYRIAELSKNLLRLTPLAPKPNK